MTDTDVGQRAPTEAAGSYQRRIVVRWTPVKLRDPTVR
jgi:hypothetical protein